MKKNHTACFNSCAILLICGFLLLLSVSQSMAKGFIREETYSLMSTRDFAFMDSISSYIANSDLRKIDSTERFYREPYKGKIDDFIFDISFYRFDKEGGKYESPSVRLRPDGSYRITVTAYLYLIGYGKGYLFHIGKLCFYSDDYLLNYFSKELKSETLKCFFNGGMGYNWSFIIDNGKITAAYGFYSSCEVPEYVIDLITGKKIEFHKYTDIFGPE